MRRFLDFLKGVKGAASLSIPFYVTRKNADGIIATYSIGGAFVLVLCSFGPPLIVFNIIGWAAFGAYELVSKVI